MRLSRRWYADRRFRLLPNYEEKYEFYIQDFSAAVAGIHDGRLCSGLKKSAYRV